MAYTTVYLGDQRCIVADTFAELPTTDDIVIGTPAKVGKNDYTLGQDRTWIQTSFGGAVGVRDTGVQGGRNPDSTTNNYNAVHEEVNKTLFNPDATTETVITGAPAYFYGFMSRTGTGTLTIRDDSAVNGAASDFKTFTLGTDDVNFPFGILMDNGITAQLGTGTDDCTIFWRAK